jgi:hypothetical protein
MTSTYTPKTSAILIAAILAAYTGADQARQAYESATAHFAAKVQEGIDAGFDLKDIKADLKQAWLDEGVKPDTIKKRFRYMQNYLTLGTARGEAQTQHDAAKQAEVRAAKEVVRAAAAAGQTLQLEEVLGNVVELTPTEEAELTAALDEMDADDAAVAAMAERSDVVLERVAKDTTPETVDEAAFQYLAFFDSIKAAKKYLDQFTM